MSKKTVVRHPLLCHHPKSEYDHCIELPVFGTCFLICARCLGYALTFFPLFLMQFFNVFQFAYELRLVIYLLPLPAHIEWINEKFSNSKKGSNAVRLVTGALLGCGASYLLWLVTKNPLNFEPYLVVFAYLVLAAIGCAQATNNVLKRFVV